MAAQAKAAVAEAASRDSEQRATIREQTAVVGAAAGRLARLQERLDAAEAAAHAAQAERARRWPKPPLCREERDAVGCRLGVGVRGTFLQACC